MKSKTHPPGSQSERRSGHLRKARLDVLLVERGFAPSRQRAQAMLLAGQVSVNGERQNKAGSQTAADARIEITGEPLRYSSRGGLKLEGALDDFRVAPQDRVCLDVGSSTGGFTDCLLQRGARKVYAVDVTVNQLDWKLRHDARVVALERNARYLQPEDLGELVDFVTIDVSFISVTKILPAIAPLATSGAHFMILVKPQFELDRREVGKGGIVRHESLHQKAIERVVAAAVQSGLEVTGVRASRLPGAEGNQEFFLHAYRRD
jgi:23S rRNA (cytidine1920-2'-O)/16S rRNA (cytidine1409-2'-O)-methyltransferase